MGKASGTRIAGLIALATLLSACATSLIGSHEPMHPVTDSVLLKAEATGLIDRIELRIQRFSIDPISGVETPETPVLLVEVCDPGILLVSRLRCWYRAPWSGHYKMIEFQSKVLLWNGTSRTETYKFASGNYPFEGAPIPIRAKGDPKATLDVVIIPDSDLLNDWYVTPWNPDGNWDGFRSFLDDLVEGVYFDFSAVREWRGLYNFYYSPKSANFDEATCTFMVPDNLAELQVVADSLLYAHSKEMWDCKLNDKFSSENWYGKSIAHETGHALFGLRDEYAGANYGFYPPHACMSNIFSSEAVCAAEAPSIGLPASFCVLADATWGVWRIDPADAKGSLMGPAQHYSWSDFGLASLRRISWRYDKCLSGDCMAADECDF
jgi:hypothetical protein